MEGLIAAINECVRLALSERGLDARQCYTHVHPQPPDGVAVEVQCSDPEVLRDIERRVTGRVGRDSHAARFVPLPGAGSGNGRLIAVSSVADVRSEPAHTAELVSQIIYGDPVDRLKEEGDWILCRLEDGYLGWIRSWHVAAVDRSGHEAYLERAAQRVAINHAEVLDRPSPEGLPVTDLVVGTPVATDHCGTRGWRAVELPDGRTGFIKSRAIEPRRRLKRVSRERLAATGLKFLGIPYLWGGTTPKGFDCSGLIQRVYRLNGVLLPRDADQQSRYGALIPAGDPERLQCGALVFFGASDEKITHVAMSLPDGLFLHAYGQVKVGSFDPRHRLYDAKLLKDWRLCRDPLRGAGV